MRLIDANKFGRCLDIMNGRHGKNEIMRIIIECYKDLVDMVPSIDIVCCRERKWSKANGTYQWCGRLDSTARITADDFCSYGERREP